MRFQFHAVKPNGEVFRDAYGSMKEVKDQVTSILEEDGIWYPGTPIRVFRQRLLNRFRVRAQEPGDTPTVLVEYVGYSFTVYRYSR